MDAQTRRKNRRLRYGYGLVSSYFIETGQPLQEKITREAQRTKAIREAILEEERPKTNKKKIRRDKQREDRGYGIIIDEAI